MSSIDRRTFMTFGGGAAAFATIPLVACGGGGDAYPSVAAAANGPMAMAKDGSQFTALANEHTLLVTAANGTQKRYGGVGTAQGKLNFPAGVAVIDNIAYVVETGNHRVQVFDAAGNSLRLIGVGELLYPGGIAAGSNEIFVADSRHARVVAFSLTGEVTRVLGAGVLSAPRGMVVVDDGVIVADPGLRKVVKLGFDGRVQGEFASGLTLPWDVTTDGANVYIADVSSSQLTVAALSGSRVDAITLPAAPANVWFRSGTLYVA